jgi:small conductance mechanosensitive channel
LIFSALGPDRLPLISNIAHPSAATAAKGGAEAALWSKLVDTGGDFVVNLAAAALILAVTIWAANWTGRLLRRALVRIHHRGVEADPTLAIFASSLARNAVFLLGGIEVLQQLGVKTTSIIAAIGAASLAVGLAMQGALSNVAAGVMIFLFRPYRVGDIIESSGRTGRVRSLDLFVTELATLDNLKIVIPNSKVFGDVILNHSFHDRRRADVNIHAPPTVDVVSLMQRLRKRLASDPRVLTDPEPLLEVTNITETFVEIYVRPWVARDDFGPVKADVLLWARLLESDPKTALPAPARGKAEPRALPLEPKSLL